MNARLLCLISFITGAIISVMVTFNTELGTLTTNEVSITINQIVGIITLTIVMLCFRKNETINPPRKQAPWYLWGGGIFGLVVITCNYFSVRGAGTTIAMASAVFGQCVAGLVFDLTGLMGMEKRHVGVKKTLGIFISFIGIIIMLCFSGESIRITYALIGASAGIITMIQMVYNSRLAGLKGAFFSARQNVISGLIGILLYSFAIMPEATITGWKAVPGIPILILVGGGVLACFVVVFSNTVIPRIPAATSSVLMSSGQVLTAAILDAALYNLMQPSLVIGSLLMIAGIIISNQS